MPQHETEHTVRAWPIADSFLEWHRYPTGPAGTAPPHVHDEYQICLSLDTPGEYRVRRSRFPVPVGSLSVLHPGEVHSSRDPCDRHTSATYRLLYLAPDRLAAALRNDADAASRLPVFPVPIVLDRLLASRFLVWHSLAEMPASQLEVEERLVSFLVHFVQRHAEQPLPLPTAGQERRAVRTVRDYLEAHYADQLSLEHLAGLVDLSPYHLVRVFRREVGLPPHAYQLGMRITRARNLLLRGESLAQVAADTGFADQSHFTRLFKRFVGTPPGRYVRKRNIVQDE